MRIVFDIDGVIATGTKESVYSDEAGWAYEKCEPIWPMIKAIQILKERGVYVVLHTARWDKDVTVTANWLRLYDVPFDELIMGKPSADLYVDDKSFPTEFLGTERGESLAQLLMGHAEVFRRH